MNWFTPKCPVNDKEKDWIEDSFLWILGAFSLKSLKGISVILPTPEFFPDTYSGEEEHVRKLLDRVCSFMDVDSDRLELELCPDEVGELRHHLPFFKSSGKGAAGQYQQGADKIKIKIRGEYVRDPMSLVAIVAHELGHVLLLGDGKISRERTDHEELTDLLTVVFGLGIFTGNSAFNFNQWSGGFKQGWQAKRLGYLTESMFGYALAVFAWAREEDKPPWSKYLEGNVKYYFKAGLKYLEKTGDSKLKRREQQQGDVRE